MISRSEGSAPNRDSTVSAGNVFRIKLVKLLPQIFLVYICLSLLFQVFIFAVVVAIVSSAKLFVKRACAPRCRGKSSKDVGGHDGAKRQRLASRPYPSMIYSK